jgi:hypothetical protein
MVGLPEQLPFSCFVAPTGVEATKQEKGRLGFGNISQDGARSSILRQPPWPKALRRSRKHYGGPALGAGIAYLFGRQIEPSQGGWYEIELKFGGTKRVHLTTRFDVGSQPH